MSSLNSRNSNNSLNLGLNPDNKHDNELNDITDDTVTNDDVDEFMNDDDGGFRQVTVNKEEFNEKGKLIAQMHNQPDYIIDKTDRSSRQREKYTQLPKKHLLKEFLQYFCETRPGVEVTEELLAEQDLLPKRPKTSLLP